MILLALRAGAFSLTMRSVPRAAYGLLPALIVLTTASPISSQPTAGTGPAISTAAAGFDDYFEFGPSFPDPGPFLLFSAVLDYDTDGDLDIVYPTFTSPTSPAPLVALTNDGAGRLVSDSKRVFGGEILIEWARDFAVGDFNGDGRTDLFVGAHGFEPPGVHGSQFPGGQSHILIQQSGGGLRDETASRLPQETSFTHHTAVGDIDKDGDLDLYLGGNFECACTHSAPRFYINDGNGFFTSDASPLPAAVRNLTSGFPSSALVDVDGDLDLDLVLGGSINELHDRVLTNNGEGQFDFAPETVLPARAGQTEITDRGWVRTEWATWDVASGDFNGDGDADLLMATLYEFTSLSDPDPQEGNETAVQLLLNNGDGTFRDASYRIPQHWPRSFGRPVWIVSIYPTDLNGDGWLDFITNALGSLPRIFYNVDGEYFVDASEVIPIGGGTWSLVPGDFDGDGDVDVFGSNWGTSRMAYNVRPFVHDASQAPLIEEFTPTSGPAFEQVQVRGQRLGQTVSVYVDGVKAEFTVVSDTELRVTVPLNAHSGPIMVVAAKGISLSAQSFSVRSIPIVIECPFLVAVPGTELVIKGYYFEGITRVTFGGVEAAFTIISDNELATIVPADGRTGRIELEGPHGTGVACESFVVMVPPAQPYTLRFEGDDDLVAVRDAARLNLGDAFTMETWLYLEGSSPYAITMGKAYYPSGEDPYRNYTLGFAEDGQTPVLDQSTGSPGTNRRVAALEPLPWHSWAHVAGTLDGGVLRLYVNGSLAGETDSHGRPNAGTIPFSLGNGASPSGEATWNGMRGRLRQARVWSRALSPDELANAAILTLTGQEADLVGYWPLDDGAGQMVRDLGPHGYHLVLGTQSSTDGADPQWTANVTPALTLLAAPANEAMDLPRPHVLSWHAVPVAERYRLQVASDSGFSRLVVDQASLQVTTYTVNDAVLATGETYYWRVRATNIVGEGPWSAVRSFSTATGVAVEAHEGGIPDRFALHGNYPNPFNPSTLIRFDVPTSGHVRLSVFDLLGREIALLVDGWTLPGRFEVAWHAAGLPSGVYLYRLQARDYTSSRRLLLLK